MRDEAIKCYNMANAFFETAVILSKNRMIYGYYLSSLITNLSFSCELYLKTMIMCEKNEKVKGHELKYLLKKLEEKNQSIVIQIEDEYNKNYKYVKDFRQIINLCDNNFQDFRYLYEDELKDTASNQLSNVAIVFKKICQEVYGLI